MSGPEIRTARAESPRRRRVDAQVSVMIVQVLDEILQADELAAVADGRHARP